MRLTGCLPDWGGGQEMSAVEAAFGENSSRIPTVKAEVLCEYDSKHRAVNISAPSHVYTHEEIGVYPTPTNQPDWAWLLFTSTYAQCISRLGAYSVFSCPNT